MNTVVYRDKSFKNHLLVPIEDDGERSHCIEITNYAPRDGVHLVASKYYVPNEILERHYRKEEL